MGFLPVIIWLIVLGAVYTIGLAGIVFIFYMIPAPIIAALIATVGVLIMGDL